jgi:ferredoxin
LSVIDHFPVYIDSFLCTGCGDCANICPCDAIVPDEYPSNPPEPNPESIFDVDWFFDYSEPYYWGSTAYPNKCNELVRDIYLDNGLPYDYRNTSDIIDDPNFIPVSSPVDGDIVLWPGEHMGIYINNFGNDLFSSTIHHNVTYCPFSWFEGNPIFLRYISRE